ncbi:hypothetical protein QNH98_08645 [Myroides sp. mNGS23_01]|nr:hypothetical protein [Myroides sp. mNGS23_01]WHT40597.1 hypothetical protein QNH98_08645 [Myroides sp. mNGS23_01]
MKKVLEGELLSIVHRVLQMKDTDVDKLYVEAKELYEKLQILKFYQDNLALGLVNDITEDQLVAKLSAVTQAETNEQEIAMITTLEEEARSQIPADLIVEDYPIVVEAEKETVVDFDAPTLVEEEIAEEEETSLEFEQEEVANEIEEEQEEEAEQDEVANETEEEQEEKEFAALVEEEVEEELEEEQEEEELEEEEVEEWTEEDEVEVLEEEELADQVVAETTVNEETFEFQEEKTEEVFAPLTGDQREDNPFEGFDFGEIEFIRVEDLAKEDTILVDDSRFERVVEQTAPVEENQSTENFFAQQKDEQTKQQEEKEEDKVEHQQNMLFNLDQVSVREPRIVKKSINDIYRGTIVVGLNDRIAFEKHLFANSSEDFNRVLSQLNTVSTYDEARSFVEHLVKPEYNNWEGKEEYAERFMALIEKRFE